MSPQQDGPAATVADILGLPLEEFTPARDRLAKELRKAGDRDGAAEVAALRKPGVHLWAVNQLARQREMAVKRLLATAADLASAQEEVFTGSAGAGDRLRRDSGEYQRALDQAVRETRDLLRAATRGAGEETMRRVREVLANGALGPAEQRERLAAGALADEPEPLGFGAFAAQPSASPRAAVPPTAPAARTKAPTKERATEPKPSAATAEDRAAERARERARRAEEAAAAEAERARKAELRRDLDHAEADLRRAQQTAHRLRRRAEATAAEARAAAEEAERAEAAARAAAEAVEEARGRLD